MGSLLAEVLGWEHIDTDNALEAHYSSLGSPLTCRQIHQKFGEAKFRQLEAAVLTSLLGSHHSVISIGGGTVEDARNIALLKQLGKSCYLKQARASIYRRLIESKGLPSYLDALNPRLSFEQLAGRREMLYASIADFTLDITGQTPQEIVEKILSWLYAKDAIENGLSY